MPNLIKFVKGVVLTPFYLAALWLILAGSFQSWQMYRWSAAKLDQAQQVKAAASNPLTLFTRGDEDGRP